MSYFTKKAFLGSLSGWIGLLFLPFIGASQTLEDSSVFLSRASTGANWEMLNRVSEIGKEAWISEQMSQPYLPITPMARSIIDEFSTEDNFLEFNGTVFRYALWNKLLGDDDVLRQRVALALSEILVVSEVGSELESSPVGLALYFDLLARHAFGNYRDLLTEIVFSPCMGSYLSHAGNQKADRASNRFPDENFAREIMQLFTIGLHQLNLDGSEVAGPTGDLVQTYNNDTIEALARVFTGLIYNYDELVEEYPRLGQDDEFLFDQIRVYGYTNFEDRMVGVESQHDKAAKTLLNGRVLPAGQSIQQDIDDAIDCLVNHPNTAPFVSKLLIQRLVTSNPSPEYIRHVASVFRDNGQGISGDLRAVVISILLFPDQNMTTQSDHFGKMREPFIKMLHALRGFDAANSNGSFWNSTWWEWDVFKQRPFSSPSVFNFFLPNYAPQGALSEAGWVAPEFQIFDSQTIPSSIDFFMYLVFYDLWNREDEDDLDEGDPLSGGRLKPWRLDLTDELLIAHQEALLVDRLSLILTGGTLSENTKGIVAQAIRAGGDDPEYRVRLGIWAILISPEYNIQK